MITTRQKNFFTLCLSFLVALCQIVEFLLCLQVTFLSNNPANIRLDEEVLKTSFFFVFIRRLQDVLIKKNMFALALHLKKTSSRRLQDVLVKTNIFVLTIRLQGVFKTFSRRLQDVFQTISRPLQNVFKTSSRPLFIYKQLGSVFSSQSSLKF